MPQRCPFWRVDRWRPCRSPRKMGESGHGAKFRCSHRCLQKLHRRLHLLRHLLRRLSEAAEDRVQGQAGPRAILAVTLAQSGVAPDARGAGHRQPGQESVSHESDLKWRRKFEKWRKKLADWAVAERAATVDEAAAEGLVLVSSKVKQREWLQVRDQSKTRGVPLRSSRRARGQSGEMASSEPCFPSLTSPEIIPPFPPFPIACMRFPHRNTHNVKA